jgi:hypothetical protein
VLAPPPAETCIAVGRRHGAGQELHER